MVSFTRRWLICYVKCDMVGSRSKRVLWITNSLSITVSNSYQSCFYFLMESKTAREADPHSHPHLPIPVLSRAAAVPGCVAEGLSTAGGFAGGFFAVCFLMEDVP